MSTGAYRSYSSGKKAFTSVLENIPTAEEHKTRAAGANLFGRPLPVSAARGKDGVNAKGISASIFV